MRYACEDPDAEIAFRAALGVVVLAVAVACANIGAVPIDTEPFLQRLADRSIRTAFTTGYVLQLLTGIWLALSLLLDVRRGMRVALVCWLAALALFLAPVPTVREAFWADLVPVAGVLLVGIVGWVLDRSLREQQEVA